MRLGSIRGVEIRGGPLLLLVVALCCALGRLDELLQAMLALILHECGHAIVAAAFEQRVYALELQPFGCAMRMRVDRLSPHAELCIAVAGPIVSFIAAGAIAAVAGMLPRTAFRLDAFLRFSLTLAFVNLLPALPLDGGRVLRALLRERIGEKRASRLTGWAGVGFGVLLTLAAAALAALSKLNLSLLVMGIFLLVAAIRELKETPESRVSEVLRRTGAIGGGEAVPVKAFAVYPAMRAKEALRLIQGNRFHVLRVVDRQNRTLGEVDEAQVVLAITRAGLGVTVGEILSFDRG